MVAMIWGSTFIVIKDSVSKFDVFAIITLRFIVASIPLAFLIWKNKGNAFQNWQIGLLSGVAQFMTYAPQTIGLQTTSPSNSAFITGLFVVFTPIISFLFTRKLPKKKEVFASVIAIVGLWILTGGVQNFNYGDFITILTAVAISVCLVLTAKSLEKGTSSIVLTFQQMFVTAVLAGIIALVTHANFIASDTSVYLSILYLGIFASFIAFAVQNAVLKSLNANLVSIIIATEPFFALLFSWGFGFEIFNSMKLLGGIIMLFAIILPELNFNKNNKKKTSKK
jgi:drug/metabolite transporter (DMT)-like permease